MTKITHKGLWFEYSSLNKEDKSIFKKMTVTALICGFLIGIAANKSDLEFLVIWICQNPFLQSQT